MDRDAIAVMNPEAVILDGLDDAIIGMAERINLGPVVAYDVNKIIDILKEDMEFLDAVEYYDFNIKGAWMGEHSPIFIEIFQ